MREYFLSDTWKKNCGKVRVLLFLTGFVILFCLISDIMYKKGLYGIWDYTRKIDGFYEEPENSLDVVTIGSSLAFCNINAMELWNEFGIPNYIFGNGNQAAEVSYYYLQETFKRQNPKVILLEGTLFKSSASGIG